jgi:GNAT superfamily N-acetyltransferase
MRLDISITPNQEDIEYLTDKINQESMEFGSAYNFGFFLRDEKNNIIAGCNGSVIYGSIYTDQLWVDHDHRNKGLGRQLMEAVHNYGIENGCKIATVTTMSFQKARQFYEKLGYKIDFERKGYIMESSAIFLKKLL